MVARWRQRQKCPFELETSLVCIASSMGVIETLLICFLGGGWVFVLNLAAINLPESQGWAANLQFLVGDCAYGCKSDKHRSKASPHSDSLLHFPSEIRCLLDLPYLTCFPSQPTAAAPPSPFLAFSLSCFQLLPPFLCLPVNFSSSASGPRDQPPHRAPACSSTIPDPGAGK